MSLCFIKRIKKYPFHDSFSSNNEAARLWDPRFLWSKVLADNCLRNESMERWLLLSKKPSFGPIYCRLTSGRLSGVGREDISRPMSIHVNGLQKTRSSLGIQKGDKKSRMKRWNPLEMVLLSFISSPNLGFHRHSLDFMSSLGSQLLSVPK